MHFTSGTEHYGRYDDTFGHLDASGDRFDVDTQSYAARSAALMTVADDVRRSFPTMTDVQAIDYARQRLHVSRLDPDDPAYQAYVAVLLRPEDVIIMLDRIVKQHPDNRNPQNGESGACLYREVEEPDPLAVAVGDEEAAEPVVRRCLIGQLFHELGFTYDSDWEGGGAYKVALKSLGFSRDATYVMTIAQAAADRSSGVGDCRRWEDAWESFKQDFPRYFDSSGAPLRVAGVRA